MTEHVFYRRQHCDWLLLDYNGAGLIALRGMGENERAPAGVYMRLG